MAQRQRRLRTALILAASAVLVASCGSDVQVSSRPGTDIDGRPTESEPFAVAAPRDGRDTASFAIINGVTSVVVRSADTGDDLFRIASPEGASVRPVPVLTDDAVQLQIASTGLAGPSAIDIQLSDAVVWDVRLGGGATDTTVDFGSGRLSALAFTTGSSRIEATLPQPTGEQTVRMSGGASDFVVHLPVDAPAQARLGGGAARVVIDGVSSSGIGGGDVRSSAGWDAAADRYVIDCTVGVSTLTIDHG